jgi:hypothetical protein
MAVALQPGCNEHHKEGGSGEEGDADRCAQIIHIFAATAIAQSPSLRVQIGGPAAASLRVLQPTVSCAFDP